MAMTPQQLFELLRKPERFTSEDFQRLREGLLGASASFHHEANKVWLASRLAVEAIHSITEFNDSIRRLDGNTTNLVNTTNKLTSRIFWLTVVAVGLAIVQLVLGISALRH